MLSLVWTIPLWPLLGFLLNGFFGRRWGKNTAGVIGCATVLISFLVSAGAFSALLSLPERRFITAPFDWISVGNFHVPFSFMLDPLSAVMILVVSGVGFLIHVYSVGYMGHDPDQPRYFSFLNLFVFFMLTLVLADNFLVMYIGWEGVGLCSYLLIGFWFRRPSAAAAGMKAFVVNRIGDLGFSLAIFLIFWNFGTVTFSEVFERAPAVAAASGGLLTAIGLLLFMGATGKSAQIPLYVWLPDAMEGPTPVSALIHAATMVTAGVYMVARCSVLFSLAPVTLLVVAIIGGATAIFAASMALVQNDIKKVLAYSTISQLGYMFLALGVGAFAAGIFHLMTHAFFKALLFLGAGSVIHAMSNEQDLRKMGGLKHAMPVTYWTFLIAALAIAGVPPLAGFVSKDEILWQSFSSPIGSWLLWLVATITALLTAFYMFRLVFLAFHGEKRYSGDVHPHESPASMARPLMVLGVLSVIGGWIGWPKILGGGSWFEHFLAPVFEHAEKILPAREASHSLGLEYGLMAVSIAVGLLGIGWAYKWYVKSPESPEKVRVRFTGIYNLLLNKYWVDEIYDAVIVRPLIGASRFVYRRFDLAVVDGAANGIARLAQSLAAVGVSTATGRFRLGAVTFAIGCVVALGWVVYMFMRVSG
ncbi:MAG: NADH-quinone oxidoreductase subunit L [candidate division Zixibacteria bacterium]|nr:NADH-quinone oxidoreductase subunit L [candidate division Zixibacteria bacterium]